MITSEILGHVTYEISKNQPEGKNGNFRNVETLFIHVCIIFDKNSQKKVIFLEIIKFMLGELKLGNF